MRLFNIVICYHLLLEKEMATLENPIDRGTWQAMVHRIAKTQTRLKQLSMPAHKRVELVFSPEKEKRQQQQQKILPDITCEILKIAELVETEIQKVVARG